MKTFSPTEIINDRNEEGGIGRKWIQACRTRNGIEMKKVSTVYITFITINLKDELLFINFLLIIYKFLRGITILYRMTRRLWSLANMWVGLCWSSRPCLRSNLVYNSAISNGETVIWQNRQHLYAYGIIVKEDAYLFHNEYALLIEPRLPIRPKLELYRVLY